MRNWDAGVLSSARFAWLLGTNEVCQDDQLDPADVQAASEFALSSWQVLPVVGPRLLAWAGIRYRDSPYFGRIQDLIVSVKVLSGVQMLLCQRYARELERRRVPYSLLKGVAVRLSAYPAPDLRGGLDVDVGVPSRHLEEAEWIARSLGFSPASLTDETRRHFRPVDPVERSMVEAGHYELACLVRRQVIRDLAPEVEAAIRRSIPVLKPWHLTPTDEVACYVTLDVHHGLCLDIEVDPLVASAQPTSSGAYRARVPRLDWLVLHLIFKIYWEGVHSYRKGAYQYADLVRVIPRVRGEIAEALTELLSRYSLEAAGYYVLRRVESDFGVSLSPELRAFLARHAQPPTGAAPTDLNDLGDMWPKIWGYR